MLTEPEKWSAAAVYQATRIFTSTLKEKMAQRFFNQVKYFSNITFMASKQKQSLTTYRTLVSYCWS